MAERHDAERSVVEARARLTRVTEELSRRATPEYVKGKARERATEMTAQAKVVARERTVEMKDRFLDSPMALGLVGGAVGAIAGKMIGDRTKARHGRGELGSREFRGGYEANERGYRSEYYGRDYESRGFDVPYDEYTATHPTSETIITEDPMYGLDTGERGDRMEGIRESGDESSGGLKEKAGELKGKASEKAGELKGKASEKFADVKDRARSAASSVRDRGGAVRERLPSREDLKHRASAIRERVPSREQFRSGARRVGGSVNDRPEVWGLAAVIAGAVFGALMPLTNRERRVLGPVKSDAKGRVRAAADELTQRADSFKEGVKSGLTSEGDQGEQRDESGGGYGGDMDTRYHSGSNLGGTGYHASEYMGGGTGYSAGSSGGFEGRSDIRERDERSTSSEDTSIASHDTGAVGGYGSDSGFSAGTQSGSGQTYSAGGSEDETKREGYNPIPDPDVTRH